MSKETKIHIIDAGNLAASLGEFANHLTTNESGGATLDLQDVARIDPQAVRLLTQIADTADQKNVELTVKGANIDVYRVLKLTKLSYRFQFEPDLHGPPLR